MDRISRLRKHVITISERKIKLVLEKKYNFWAQKFYSNGFVKRQGSMLDALV